MTKSLINKSHKEKAMEFKPNNDVVIVDEKVTTVFEAKQVTPDLTPEQKILANRRMVEAFSDCG
jgi:hypothetical protein